jgi:predicted metal-dependent hydrolase
MASDEYPHKAGISDITQDDMESLDKGIALFNEGKFFEAHEQWEKVWRKMKETPGRRCIQGLIKIAAALVHYKRGEYTGTSRLIENGSRMMLNVSGENLLGIDIESFLKQVSFFYERFKASEGNVSESDFPQIRGRRIGG